MNREAQSVVLVLLGGAILRISMTDVYLRYVKAGLRPFLIVSGVLLIVIAAVTLYREVFAPARVVGEDHGADGDTGVDGDTGDGAGTGIGDGASTGADAGTGDGAGTARTGRPATHAHAHAPEHAQPRVHGHAPEHAAHAAHHPATRAGTAGRAGPVSHAGTAGHAGPVSHAGTAGARASGAGHAALDGDAGRDGGAAVDGGAAHDGHVGDGGHGHDHAGPRVAWLLVVPVFAIFLVGPPALGSFAASRGGTSVAKQSQYAPLPSGDPVALPVLDYASRAVWDRGASLTDRRVRLTGFVSPRPGGGVYLTRMILTCCAADGRPVKVGLSGAAVPAGLPADTWIEVTGRYDPEVDKDRANNETIPYLEAESVREVTQPTQPYEQ